jgi:hypothetical protein
VFYAGLEPYGFVDEKKRGLYIIGYFEIQVAGRLTDFSKHQLFGNNFHVRYRTSAENPILVKGNEKSRLLRFAYLISDMGVDRAGHGVYVLSDEMRKIFGNFTQLNAIQRSTPRWVSPEKVETAARWIRQLR